MSNVSWSTAVNVSPARSFWRRLCSKPLRLVRQEDVFSASCSVSARFEVVKDSTCLHHFSADTKPKPAFFTAVAPMASFAATTDAATTSRSKSHRALVADCVRAFVSSRLARIPSSFFSSATRSSSICFSKCSTSVLAKTRRSRDESRAAAPAKLDDRPLFFFRRLRLDAPPTLLPPLDLAVTAVVPVVCDIVDMACDAMDIVSEASSATVEASWSSATPGKEAETSAGGSRRLMCAVSRSRAARRRSHSAASASASARRRVS